MKSVLTIAGSDSSGGAGIQADLKTITAHNIYGTSVITALTAQNTLGVTGIMEVAPDFVAKQLDCVFTDIFPNSVKIGMVSNTEIIEVICDKLIEYKVQNIVVDPVMVSTSGSKLISDEALEVLVNKLLPLGLIITPNIPEAEILSNISIKNQDDMIKAAEIISKNLSCGILIKGGHLVNEATDLLFEKGKISWFTSPRIETTNTHGTGCTLSSAIACNLAKGLSIYDSIEASKNYLTSALAYGLDLGQGSGPVNHMFILDKL
ncbi:MAG: bifunctional hydroxymethylpyrimidine kinase/phosphomethylpyrimidine kinase [Lachnospirales bacterium]